MFSELGEACLLIKGYTFSVLSETRKLEFYYLVPRLFCFFLSLSSSFFLQYILIRSHIDRRRRRRRQVDCINMRETYLQTNLF